jgi:DNA-binding transcriptional regulator YdaS (Cro superfamily)
MDEGFHKVLTRVKSRSALATALGINRQAVSKWDRVPAERVMEVEAVTGIPRSVIRPDIYPPERERKRPRGKK